MTAHSATSAALSTTPNATDARPGAAQDCPNGYDKPYYSAGQNLPQQLAKSGGRIQLCAVPPDLQGLQRYFETSRVIEKDMASPDAVRATRKSCISAAGPLVLCEVYTVRKDDVISIVSERCDVCPWKDKHD